MTHLHNPNPDRWFIVQNGAISYGLVTAIQQMDSGLPNLETFTDKQLWLDRLVELGVDISEIE